MRTNLNHSNKKLQKIDNHCFSPTTPTTNNSNLTNHTYSWNFPWVGFIILGLMKWGVGLIFNIRNQLGRKFIKSIRKRDINLSCTV